MITGLGDSERAADQRCTVQYIIKPGGTGMVPDAVVLGV
jgi:hypothetical protein